MLISVIACKNSNSDDKKTSVVNRKRDFNVIKTIIEAAIKAGPSIKSAYDALKGSKAALRLVGTIENPTKWNLNLFNCDVLKGTMSVPMSPSISPGLKEGFTSENDNGDIRTKCTLSVNKRSTFLHLAYKIPQGKKRKMYWRLQYAVKLKRSA